MKKSKNSYLLFGVTIFFFLFVFFGFLFLNKVTIRTYFTLTAIPLTENEVVVAADLDKKIEKGKFFYLKNKKIFYEIEDITKEDNYHYYVLSLSKKIDRSKNMDISIPLEKKSLLKILYQNWRLE